MIKIRGSKSLCKYQVDSEVQSNKQQNGMLFLGENFSLRQPYKNGARWGFAGNIVKTIPMLNAEQPSVALDPQIPTWSTISPANQLSVSFVSLVSLLQYSFHALFICTRGNRYLCILAMSTVESDVTCLLFLYIHCSVTFPVLLFIGIESPYDDRNSWISYFRAIVAKAGRMGDITGNCKNTSESMVRSSISEQLGDKTCNKHRCVPFFQIDQVLFRTILHRHSVSISCWNHDGQVPEYCICILRSIPENNHFYWNTMTIFRHNVYINCDEYFACAVFVGCAVVRM